LVYDLIILIIYFPVPIDHWPAWCEFMYTISVFCSVCGR